MGLSKETQDRIANDAKEKFPIPVVFADQPGCMNKREGYIAGATAEAERAQILVDALDAFIQWQGSTLKNWPVMEQAHKSLQQFKDGKEVGDDK